jgi:hypothetical protein
MIITPRFDAPTVLIDNKNKNKKEIKIVGAQIITYLQQKRETELSARNATTILNHNLN